MAVRLLAQPLAAVVYFVSFVLLGTMIMLNLFIGVVISSMQEAQTEAERRAERRHGRDALVDEIDELTARLERVRRLVLARRERSART